MTCRHALGDPNCSSNPNGYAAREQRRASTPDADNYEVVEVERVGPNLVMKVLYPNCSKCSYEGNKVMVFLNVSEMEVLRWQRIDPHFRDPSRPRQTREAPSPAARFPASDEGWHDAVAYARTKLETRD